MLKPVVFTLPLECVVMLGKMFVITPLFHKTCREAIAQQPFDDTFHC
jgi:hypothetical protein